MALGDYTLTLCGLLFHPHASLWGRELPVRALTPRSWWGRRETKRHPNWSPSHAESDSHYQLWLFLFHFTASSYWQPGTEGETKRQFSSNRITHQNQWDECAVESQRASWTQCGEMKIYAFNGKHGMTKGWETGRKGRSFTIQLWWRGAWEGYLGTRVSVFSSCPDPSLPTWHGWGRSSQQRLSAVAHEPLNLPTLWADITRLPWPRGEAKVPRRRFTSVGGHGSVRNSA